MGRGGYSSSWLYPATRVAIYLRDGLGCVYCEVDWSRSSGLTVDHIIPRSQVAGRWEMRMNDAENLVTSCRRCNNLRRHIREEPLFAVDEWGALARCLQIDADMRARVGRTVLLPLAPFRSRARALVADPPRWLLELREISTTKPGDVRRRAERRETPMELLRLMMQREPSEEKIPF